MANYLSEENLNTLVDELKNKYLHTELLERYLLNYAYPIGTVYESINNISPATFLGGTWETFGAGKVLIGAGTSIGIDVTGVSKTFSVSENELNNEPYVTVYRWVRTA